MCLTLSASCVQDRARGEVERALQQRASLPEKLCQLLSGQQLSAAVALASAIGDVRLASLICQVTPVLLAESHMPCSHMPMWSSNEHHRDAGGVQGSRVLAQAAAKGEAREAVGRQLQTWQEADFVTHIDRERLNVYQLLAGHVDAVVPDMNLDWRRALGLHLW